WTRVLERAGARVQVDPAPSTGRPAAGLPPVTPVAVTAPPPITTPIVLDEGSVGFRPDVATLRDPAAAATVLAPVADALRAAPRRIRLVGTTADVGPPESRVLLATRRAEAVRDLLVADGVDPALVEVRGLGS